MAATSQGQKSMSPNSETSPAQISQRLPMRLGSAGFGKGLPEHESPWELCKQEFRKHP